MLSPLLKLVWLPRSLSRQEVKRIGAGVHLAPFYLMEKNVCIVHFNTPELTRATIRSLWKHTPGCKVTIFDNSDSIPFGAMEGVLVIDNTKGRNIDFDEMISSFPDRRESDNGYGSAKHCRSVDFLMDLFKDGFLLLDSDVLVIKDVSSLFDNTAAWVGQPHKSIKHKVNIERLYPFCCYINTKMCMENGIRYFDRDHMWQLSDGIGRWYDTGAWFLYATRALPHRKIRTNDYIIHYGGGSFKRDKRISPEEWLQKNKKYYD